MFVNHIETEGLVTLQETNMILQYSPYFWSEVVHALRVWETHTTFIILLLPTKLFIFHIAEHKINFQMLNHSKSKVHMFL